jgi:hypothetical protein
MTSVGRLLSRIICGAIYRGDCFTVKLDGPFAIIYAEAGKSMRISSELLYDDSNHLYRGIYVRDLKWNAPNDFLVIDSADYEKIVEGLIIALADLDPSAKLIRS